MKRLYALGLIFVLMFQTLAYAAEPSTGESLSEHLKEYAAETFDDVSVDAWYAESVGYCSQENLMSGVSSTTFAPGSTASRGMLAAVLYRRAGSPAVAEPATFSDVPTEIWYADAVAWAEDEGIIGGYSTGLFGGDDPVTREQFVTILYRCEGQPAIQETESFADQNEISAYAFNAVTWARNKGIISGKGGNQFDPKANITRGEMAAIMYRWLSVPEDEIPPTPAPDSTPTPPSEGAAILEVVIEDRIFTATLADTEAARQFAGQLPMTINMGELNGNEKYHYMDFGLPTAAARPGTIKAGDLMLYGSDCLVLFYETFTSSYSYTSLGKLDDPAGLAQAVGSGSITVTFRLAD